MHLCGRGETGPCSNLVRKDTGSPVCSSLSETERGMVWDRTYSGLQTLSHPLALSEASQEGPLWSSANHFTPTRMAVITKSWITSIGDNVDKQELSCTGGKLSGTAALNNSVAVPQMLNRVTIRPSNSAPRYAPKRSENTYPYGNLYTNVQSSTIHNSKKVKTTQVSTSMWRINSAWCMGKMEAIRHTRE